MRFFAVALIFFGVAASNAQTPEVPHKMHFANITLSIRDDARREIQKDVDALTRHTKYFQMISERAKTYFPIISKIFAEENLPDDFKYLALQESALVSNAVSVSNAVGFWQFKDFTALSMGLRVDKEVDERMNIASSSRGAANYLKQNNEQFDNWLLALQAYQMGAGGLKRSVGDKHNGKRHMEISSETYWYVKKFIAHKVAFEKAYEGEPQTKVIVVQSKNQQALSDLAQELQVEEQTLRDYNKWVISGVIPADKSYAVVIPKGKMDRDFSSMSLVSEKSGKAKPFLTKNIVVPKEIKYINGLEAIRAGEGESLVGLAERGGIRLNRFLKFNEMSIDQTLQAGSFYFLEMKKSTTGEQQHKVKVGEDLWAISQLYGIQLKKLKKWNGMSEHEKLPIGSIVKLNSKPILEEKVLPILPVAETVALETETFNWEVKPSEVPLEMEKKPKIIERDTVKAQNLVEVSTPAAIEHLVVRGESYYSVAKLYNVGVTDLLAWNNLNVKNSLNPGQKLVLFPPNYSEKVKDDSVSITLQAANRPFFHEVKESDTLYGIAREYGVTIKDLMDWNEKKELTVKAGEKIRVLRR